MTPAARVAEAIGLLEAAEENQRPLDGLVQSHFRSHRFIGSKDRRAIGNLVFGVIRHHARLSWHLDRASVEPTPRSKVIAFHALAMDQPVEALFAGDDRHGPDALSTAEAGFVGGLAGASLEPDEMPEAVRVECPDWAEADLRASLGDGFGDEMAALLGEAPVDIRVARRKAEREPIIASLEKGGLTATPTPHSPDGLRLEGRASLAGHRLYRDGVIEIQDEGSQLVALMCDVSPGMQVVDFCAGACGKALALADLMGGAGRIVACDVDERRLARGKARIGRSGLDNIEPRVLRDEADRWVARQKGKFDRVLVDAPCSGVGAWRRNPWARWRPPDLAALNNLQDRIMASAARLVKPGGRLIYVTCSLLASENQSRIDVFRNNHPDFRPMRPIGVDHVGGKDSQGETMLLTPLRHGTDGFFIAVMQRDDGA